MYRLKNKVNKFFKKNIKEEVAVIKNISDEIYDLNDIPYIEVERNGTEPYRVPLLAHKALKQFIGMCDANMRILDIGCGYDKIHTAIMKKHGLNIFTNDIFKNTDYIGFLTDIEFRYKFDAIWCSHVLEHTLNPHDFLVKIKNIIKNDGILCLSVPPLKHEIVGGHINLFNPGMLLYRLILAGFDCSNASIEQYGYNISIIMRVKKISVLPNLNYDIGDIEILENFFPAPVKQNFDGNFKSIQKCTFIYE